MRLGEPSLHVASTAENMTSRRTPPQARNLVRASFAPPYLPSGGASHQIGVWVGVFITFRDGYPKVQSDRFIGTLIVETLTGKGGVSWIGPQQDAKTVDVLSKGLAMSRYKLAPGKWRVATDWEVRLWLLGGSWHVTVRHFHPTVVVKLTHYSPPEEKLKPLLSLVPSL